MVCPSCQFQNSEGAAVCQNCKTVLSVPKPPETRLGQESVNVQVVPPTVTPPSEQKRPFIFRLPKIFWFLFGVATLIVLMGVSIGVVMSLRGKPVSSLAPTPAGDVGQAPDLSPTPEPLRTKYDIDSDGDAIPDFVETAIGFDPDYNNAFNCVKQACEAPGQQTSQTIQTNILFILDASGSMAESISGGVKMDLAKQALKKYAEAVPSSTNVGLMVYGHKGSNNTKDKTISCGGIDLVYPMSPIDKSMFESTFSRFSPTGWTVIGGSLRKAIDVFAGRDGQNNRVIVVSDGIETCDSDPAGAARELKSLSINPQIDVIGLAVDAATRAQLEEVAKIGGGTYKPANSAVELEDALKKTIEAARQYLICSFKTSTAYQNCLILEQYKPAARYLQNLQLQALQDKNMGEEAASRRAQSKLLDWWGNLYSQDATVSSKANQELYRQYEELGRQKK